MGAGIDSYPGSGDVTSVARAVKDRQSFVGEINQEVTRLASVLDRAETELGSILHPEYDGPNVTGENPKAIQSYIHDTYETLQYQIDRLVRLLDRVEA